MINKLKAAHDELLTASLNFDGNVDENAAAIQTAKAEFEKELTAVEAQLTAASANNETELATLKAQNEQLTKDLESANADKTGFELKAENLQATLAASEKKAADLKTANEQLSENTGTEPAEVETEVKSLTGNEPRGTRAAQAFKLK